VDAAATSPMLRTSEFRKEVNFHACPHTGIYEIGDNGRSEIFVSNMGQEPLIIERNEIIAVFDPLTQPPIEVFKPEEKWDDEEFNAVGQGENPKDPSWEKPKGLEEISDELELGPLNYLEKSQLKEIIARNLGVFAKSPDDIGKFKGFEYALKYKPDANPAMAYTKPYPSSQDAKSSINEWIERMYHNEVIQRAPTNNRYQSACFCIPKSD